MSVDASSPPPADPRTAGRLFGRRSTPVRPNPGPLMPGPLADVAGLIRLADGQYVWLIEWDQTDPRSGPKETATITILAGKAAELAILKSVLGQVRRRPVIPEDDTPVLTFNGQNY